MSGYEGDIANEVRLAVGEALTDAYEAGAKHFRDKFQERRFTELHAKRAGYRPRKRSYLQRKMRRYKTRSPLVKTGGFREEVQDPEIVAITGTFTDGTKGEVRLEYPKARKTFRSLQMREEFTTVLPEEEREVAKKIETETNDRLNR